MIIRSFKFLSVFLLLITSLVSLYGNPMDTLKLSEAIFKVDIVKQGQVFATQEDITPDQAWKFSLQQNTSQHKATVGFTADIFWVSFIGKNFSTLMLEKILEVDNPQIDWLTIYEQDTTEQFKLLAKTGDKFLFSQRPLQHRNFAIPLAFNPGETKTILLKIDKRNSSLTFPIYLWNESTFHENSYTGNLWFGVFFGIILLCLGYAFMAFLFLRKALYGWYFLLVLTSALYLFTAHGFSFQYLYPNVLDFNSYFRIYLIVALFVCMMNFSIRFLGLAVHQPVIKRLITYLFIVLGSAALASVFALDFMTRHGLWIIPIINTLLLTGALLVIYGAIRTFSKQRATVIIYFSAWGTLIVAYLIMTATEFGWIPYESLPVNPVLIGSSLETFIFSIGLTYQVRKVYNERNQLSLSIAKQQKELLKAYVEGTEKERERISRELHDDIGSRLGSLKRFISGEGTHIATLEQQIDILCNDVRTMSHQLAPPSMRITGLRQLIQQLVDEQSLREKLRIDTQFYDIPENLSPDTIHHLFRIVQEAINNIVKHANATEVDVQFFVHDNELVMTIEDNGKGFDESTIRRGIGIQNMKARTESLSGTLEISSQPANGTNLMIKIPLTANAV